jgi:raffinose/stachyose/melibiose transport system permease protein
VLIMTLPMLIIFLVLQRFIVSGLTAGAVKG